MPLVPAYFPPGHSRHWLSPTTSYHGGDTIAMAMGLNKNARGEVLTSALKAVEEALLPFQMRPHWGKMHWSDAPTLRAAYGDDAWAAFAEQREAMDPTGVFLNDYLRAHLGL